MSSTRNLKECVLCGRRGVQGFEAADARSWRCVNQAACRRRVDDAEQERRYPPRRDTTAGDAAVAGLAREVESLRATLQALEEQVAPLPKQVSKLATLVHNLAAQVRGGDEGKKTPPLSWLDLDESEGPAAAQTVLEELSLWLARVFLRYPDGAAALPECWWWHPDVVEELVALMRAWLAAYADGDATAARAADWHDRYRPGVVKRIRQATGNCSLEAHQADGERHQPAPAIPAGLALAPIADWWANHRTQTAPEPDPQLVAETRAQAARRRAGGGWR